MTFVKSHWFISLVFIALIIILVSEILFHATQKKNDAEALAAFHALVPDFHSLTNSPTDQLINYGRELVIHTSKYFGPRGGISTQANGLNCQNCHLDAGLKPFGNNFIDVAHTYPKYRDRSGELESIHQRIRDCFLRSLAGSAPDSNTQEMKALAAYIAWTGKNISGKQHPDGIGSKEIPLIGRSADSSKGSVIYLQRCQSCHGTLGQGLLAQDSLSYTYPPLWGEKSYAVSAGMYRITKLASFIRNNMPLGSTYQKPQLNIDEAWDVAAYINSKPHPRIMFAYDWPKAGSKPMDYPFGPYQDGFSELQHKFGPFQPIKDKRKK